MIANKWYCIAQTSTFDTRCSINVAFDGHDIQFSASVKYGASSINITRCIIPDGISFSIRLRESGSQWFVDITSNTKITPVVTVADSEYWSSVNKPAAEGNIILLLTDITSKYNTSSFGGDSLFELMNVGTSDVPRYAVVPKVFQGQNPGVISRTFMTFGGLGADSNGEDDPSGVSYLRNLLDVRLSEFLEDSDVLTYDKNQDLWVNKKGGFNEEKLEEYLEKYKYITEDDIKGLLVLLQWFEFDDANHAVRVKSDFNFVVPNALSFGGLGSYSGGGEGGVSYLKNLLDVQLGTLLEDGEVLVYDKHLDRWVNKSIETGLDVDSLQKYLTDNKYITSAAVDGLQGQINNNATNIALLLSWLEYDEVNKALRVKNGYNFIVDGALSFGGLGEDDNPTPGGLTQVTIQLGNNPNDSYVSENGKVILPAYPVIPTLLSAFENDKGYLVVSDLDGYAKLTDIPSVEGFALAEDLNALSKQIEGYDNKFADVGESILDIEEDISKLAPLTDLEKLEEAVNPLFGYFDANGSANNALKLGGQLPSHYATKSALDTTNGNVVSLMQRMGTAESGISTNKTNIATLTTNLSNLTGRVSTAEGTIKSHTDSIALNANNIASNAKSITTNATAITAISNRVQKFEDVIGIDSNGDVYIKGTRNFYTAGGTIGMAGLGSGGSGGGGTAGLGSVTVRVNGQDYITDASGIVTLPNYPSLAGYATEQWVGANYLGLGGGTVSNDTAPTPLIIKSNASTVAMRFVCNSANRTEVGWDGSIGAYLYSYASSSYLSIKDDGTPCYNGNTLFHSGNANRTAVSWAASNILFPQGTSATWNVHTTGAYKGITILNTVGKESEGAPISYAVGLSVSGYYGFTLAHYGGEALYWLKGSGNADWYAIIHSGNYSDYALPLSGGTIEGVFGALSIKRNNAYASAIRLENTSGVLGYIGFNDDYTARLWDRNQNDIGIIIHSGNIGSQSVASATKLQTARKIWGALFDGNADVGGGISDAGSLEFDGVPSYAGHGGYIDFHFNGSSADYTSRIIEFSSGRLTINDTLYVNNGGNVLIGTTSDNGTAKLQLHGNIHLGNEGDFEIGTGYSYSDNNRYNRIIFGSDGTGLTYESGRWTSGNVIAHRFNVGLSSVPAIAIMNSGNVLVGTTSDISWAKLNVEGAVRINDYVSFYRNSTECGYVGLGSSSSNEVMLASIGALYIEGATNILLNRSSSSGNVIIGHSADDGYKLDVRSSVTKPFDFHVFNSSTNSSFFTGFDGLWYGTSKTYGVLFTIMSGCAYDGGGGKVVFEVDANGDVWSEGTIAMAKLASSSDAKLKENIKWLSADRAMGVVRALRPTEWDWKKDHTHSFGFIAQDIQPIVPEMVSSVNDTLRLEYNQLHAFEIGAIQHIDSEVEILKRDLKNANNRIEVLENELKQYRRA